MARQQNLCAICESPEVKRRRRIERKGASVALCESCGKLVFRKFNRRRGRQRDRIVEIPSRRDWFEVLRTSWDSNDHCFRWMVSNVRLLPDAPDSPRYPTLEHTAPGKGHGGWLVVAAAINDMKSDFDFDEFKEIIPLLARILQANGDKEASSDLQNVFDRVKHFRRVKAATVSKAIPVYESG